MPVYMLHGFRWPRPLIRIHIILQNIDDAAAEWLVAPATTDALLDNFDELMPKTMMHLPHLRFVEQYDPSDVSPAAGSQPYAYVADIVEEVRLGVDLDEIQGRDVANEQSEAIAALRDRLAPEAKLAWYVVVCGDEARSVPSSEDGSEEHISYDTRNTSENPSAVETQNTSGNTSAIASTAIKEPSSESPEATNGSTSESKPRSLSKFFGTFRGNKLGKKKSFIFSRFGESGSQSTPSTPPVPAIKRPQTSTGHA